MTEGTHQMSAMDGNPHYEEGNHDNGSDNYNLAQATMALAHEQRTANLIGLWTDPNAEVSPMGGLNYGHIATQIRERLGL